MVLDHELGEALVRHVGDRLGCRRRDVTPWRDGFTWRPGGLTQHVWADSAPSDPSEGRRLHVRTSCVKGLGGTPDQAVALSEELAFNAAKRTGP